MLELFQTEWCPASRRIRQRLTELGLDYVNRQVPVERYDRAALYVATGSDTVPALVLEDAPPSLVRTRSWPISMRTTTSPSRPRRIAPRRPMRAAATWRRNAHACHWLHADRDNPTPL